MKKKIINHINILKNISTSISQIKNKNYKLTPEKISVVVFFIILILIYLIFFYEKPLSENQKNSIKRDAFCISSFDIGIKYVDATKNRKFDESNQKTRENLNLLKNKLKKNIERKKYFSHSEFNIIYEDTYNYNIKVKDNFWLKKYPSTVREESETIASRIQNCIKQNNL